MLRAQPGLQHAVPRRTHRLHHPVGTDRNDMFGIGQPHHLLAEGAGAIGHHCLHDIADEAAVLRTRRDETRCLVAAPDDDVGGALDLLDLVTIAQCLVAGEIDHLRTRRTRRRADGEQHSVTQAAADQRDGGIRVDFRRHAGRSHQHHRFADFEPSAEVGTAAHFKGDDADQTLCLVGPGSGHRQTFHVQDRRAEAGFRQARCQDLVILQAIELPGPEGARGGRRAQHDFDDRRRQTVYRMDPRLERVAALGDQVDPRDCRGIHRCQRPRHNGIAPLGPAHRLDDVAEEAGVQIAEETDEASVLRPMHKHLRDIRFRHPAHRRHFRAGLVHRLKIAPVQLDPPVLARQDGVRLRAGGDQDCARGQGDFRPVGPRDAQTGGVAEAVGFHRLGSQPLREANGLFHRLGHFFVVQGIGWAVGQLTPIGQRRAAPGFQQARQSGFPIFAFGQRPFRGDGRRVGQEFLGDFGFLGRPTGAHGGLPAFSDQSAVAQREFFHLPHVIGQAFRRGIDRRQPAADHHHGQAQLQIGDGRTFRRPGQLQCHQEVRRLSHPARQPVRNVQHRRAPRAHAQRDVIEPHRPGVVDRQRRAAAEPHAAEMGECRATLQQQPHQLQVVLVPAHGDAVLRDAAESGHDSVVEVLEQRLHVTDRGGGVKAQRLDL